MARKGNRKKRKKPSTKGSLFGKEFDDFIKQLRKKKR